MKNGTHTGLEKNLELAKFIKLLLANLHKFKCFFKTVIRNALYVPHQALF